MIIIMGEKVATGLERGRVDIAKVLFLQSKSWIFTTKHDEFLLKVMDFHY